MIYIIVPTFGRVEDTKKFVESIKNSISKDYLIVFTDDHPEKLTYNTINRGKNIEVLVSEKELWWVGSINHAIDFILKNNKIGNDDIFIIANNDVVVDKKCVNILLKEVKNNKNAIFHPRTMDHNDKEVSSGAKILSLFPYITIHPKSFKNEKKQIEMGTARFLCFSAEVLKKIGRVNKELKQYGGDNDFTLRALKFHGIPTFILRDAICYLDDTNTGIKNMNIKSFKELIKSFSSVRSPNNIYYRFQLFKGVYNPILAYFIVGSITLNTFIKFLIRKVIK